MPDFDRIQTIIKADRESRRKQRYWYTQTAIAMALHEHLGNNVHDVEPGIITIAQHPTQWNGYAQTMTAHP